MLRISGEKKQEKEESQKGYYRVERSYGAFQRLLSLPEDADRDKIDATFMGRGDVVYKLYKRPMSDVGGPRPKKKD
ncbi:MAG: Hsp20/alpha crystallin family protein [Desulfobacterales bacterium]|nr:Hsp20/alpha crystallin family protein [Desulfobacterales bacterium]